MKTTKAPHILGDWIFPWISRKWQQMASWSVHKGHDAGAWLLQKCFQAAHWIRDQTFRFRRSRDEIHIETADPKVVALFRNLARWASIIAVLIGYHVFLGWMFYIPVLISPGSGFSAMKVNAAACSILAGLSLFQIRKEPVSKRSYLLVSIAAGITIFISSMTLLEYSTGWNLHIDGLFFAYPPEVSGRMAFTTSLGFLMIGLSLILIDRPKSYYLTESFAVASAVLGLFAGTGYMYQAKAFYGQMPLYASIVVLFVSLGILFARSDRGFMAKITSNSFGGLMARRLLPSTLLIPIIIGWLQETGQRTGIYQAAPSAALSAVANVVIFLFVVWWSVNSLHRMDTKRRQAELELQDTAAKLSRSNADLEQFAYVTSHDLKEPLRAISGSVQILSNYYKGHTDPVIEEVLKHTVDGSTRMQTLIDDLLTYSRLATRESPIEPADSSEILTEALANLEATIGESKAIITSDPLPIIKADRTQFLQVLQNLISNAIKYRSERTPKIHIGVEDQKDEWLFSVRDNGIGIAPQYADRIFRLFQRLHTRREYSGTGIGLAICKKVVERHGGRIWVESEPEEGSTFYFTIPKGT